MVTWTDLSVFILVVLLAVVAGLIAYLAYRHWEVAAALIIVAIFLAGFIFLPGALAEPVIPGNIDLDDRIVIQNEDGSFSTEVSFSVEIDGLEVLLPLVINGKLVSEEEAIDHFLRTGEHLGMFSSIEEAEQFAEELHLRQEEKYLVTEQT